MKHLNKSCLSTRKDISFRLICLTLDTIEIANVSGEKAALPSAIKPLYGTGKRPLFLFCHCSQSIFVPLWDLLMCGLTHTPEKLPRLTLCLGREQLNWPTVRYSLLETSLGAGNQLPQLRYCLSSPQMPSGRGGCMGSYFCPCQGFDHERLRSKGPAQSQDVLPTKGGWGQRLTPHLQLQPCPFACLSVFAAGLQLYFLVLCLQ